MIIFRAIAAILDGLWMTLKPALRFIAWLFALVATIAFVNDVTLWQIGGERFVAMSLADHWRAFSPSSFDAVAASIAGAAAWLWDPVLVSILSVPVWAFFGCLALALAWITRQRRRIQVFAN